MTAHFWFGIVTAVYGLRLIVRKGPKVESLGERGMVLGFMFDVTYTTTVIDDFATGDRVVFYTDGITEASRPDGAFYGDRRFQETVLAGLSQPPDRFTDSLVADARHWAEGDFADDVTVVVVDRTDRVE